MITAFASADRIRKKADVTHVVILERGEERVYPESQEEAHRKLVNLNRFEFNYLRSPLLVAYDFFNPTLGLDSALGHEQRILKSLLGSSQQCLVVRSSDPKRYARLILDAIR